MRHHLKYKLVFFYLISFLNGFSSMFAQTVPISQRNMDDALRQLQLQGKLSSGYSLAARPLFVGGEITTDSLYALIDSGAHLFSKRKKFGNKTVFELLPFSLNTQFNSHHPYGWGQPGMQQAKGQQALASIGAYASFGFLSLQLRPEWAYANSADFEHNSYYGAVTNSSYHHLFLGQSSIRINVGSVSLGVSTENLWWGPGAFNALIMSSNAPGFPHLTFNSTRPVNTPVGSFEWQLIAGKLNEDTFLLREDKNLTTTYYNPESYDGSGFSGPYDPKRKWRYLNGLTITYQPKWVKGLFIGLNRVGYAYNDSLQSGNSSFFHSYLPVIFGVFRKNYAYGTGQGLKKRYKQMLSLHFRYLLPKAHTEFYGEYGWGDNQYDIRDFTLSIRHSTAYMLGVRKMLPLNKANEWLDMQAELTQLSQSVDYIIRTAGNWYGYQGGYTQQSRIIGAGIGPGNNVQTLAVSWMRGWQRLGLKLECLQHDPNNYSVHWSDYSLGFTGQQRYGRWLLNGLAQFIQSKNYAWQNKEDRFNLHSRLSLNYFF